MRNSGTLAMYGYLYPYKVPRHFDLANQIFSGTRKTQDIATDLNAQADAEHHDIRNIILSDEDICTRKSLKPLQYFKKFFDVKIIFAMRRQDLWLESWYFQNIKWQWNPALSHCSFQEFLKKRNDFHWLHYDPLTQQLEKFFGRENILLSSFEVEQQPNGPIHDFCRLVGLDPRADIAKNIHYNSSMSAPMVEFTRHLPLDEFDDPERHLLRHALETVDRVQLGHTGKQSELLMPLEQRKAILSEYADGNRAVARRFFNRDALFLHPLPAEDTPLARLDLPRNSADVIKKFVAPLLRQLVSNGTIAATPNRKP